MKLRSQALLSFLLTSCSIVSPVSDDLERHLLESSIARKTSNLSQPVVAIARPSLPPYLERSELVTRTGDGHLEVHEGDLWSEPLDAAMARVLGENLRRITGSTDIQPSKNFITRDYQFLVEIRVERFDPLREGVLLLECTWKLQPVQGNDTSARVFRVEISYDASDDLMSHRVQAMNRALGELARKIARTL